MDRNISIYIINVYILKYLDLEAQRGPQPDSSLPLSNIKLISVLIFRGWVQKLFWQSSIDLCPTS